MKTRSDNLLSSCPPIYAVVALLAAAMLFVETALAQDPRGWYAGVGAGNSHVEVYRGGWGDLWEGGPSDSAFLISGGYRFLDYLALDLGYLHTNGLEWREDVVFLRDLPGVQKSSAVMDTSALQLSAVGIWPFAQIWEAYVKGGVNWYRADAAQNLSDFSGGQQIRRSINVDDTGYLLGFGIGATLAEFWHIRLEYQTFEIDHGLINVRDNNDPTVDTWFLTVEYRFGSNTGR